MPIVEEIEEIEESYRISAPESKPIQVHEERRGRLLAALRNKRPVYVALIEADRAYGGPQEGGWWFDIQIVVEQISVSDIAGINAVVEDLKARYNNDGRYEPGTSISDGWYKILVSTKPVMCEPRQIPRWD